MINRYKPFPPGWNNIQVPTHRRSATLAGIATYGPCAARGVWAQRAAWGLVTLGGPRLLPGRTRGWQPSLAADDWAQLQDDLTATVGPFDSHTVYERRDNRQGLLMLLLDGDRSVGFVKARAGDTNGVVREEEALLLVERAKVGSFVAPRVLGSGTVAGWRYLVTSPMPPRMHRMPKAPPRAAIYDDISLALGDLDKGPDAAEGWLPFHGDFTPWNLRQIRDATPWLIDWEDAGWGPPDADRVFYEASAAAIGHPVSNAPLEDSEAVSYWWDEMNRRTRDKLADGIELGRIDYGMLDALAAGSRS